MKKTAVIITDLNKIFGSKKGGGGEALIKNLIQELSKMPDVQLSVFAPFSSENKSIDVLKAEYPNINFNFYYQSPYNFSYIDELNGIFEKKHFDIIINSNQFAPFKTTLLQCHSYIHRLNKTSLLLRPFKRLSSKNYINVQKYVFARAAGDSDYTAVSNTIKEDYCKNFNIPKDKIKVVYPGTVLPKSALQQEKSAGVKTPCFGIAAGSSVNKGGHYLLAALGILNLFQRKFKLKIIAPKYSKDPLMQLLVLVFGLKNKIEVLDFQSDMTEFYQTIDALVLPSFNEAFGLVSLEAMAYSKPCIVSSSAGCAEIINDGSGMIFNRSSFFAFFDLIKKLDSMIKIISSDAEKYNAMRLCARSTAEKFSWRRFAQEIIS